MSPVVHDITVRIVLTILLMPGWAAHIVDVKGHFYWVNSEKMNIFI